MSTAFEQQLRTEMERATSDVRISPGLALRAYQRNRKRRTTMRVLMAAGGATVLAAGALAVAGMTGTPGSAAGQYQTTSYVISRVEHALSALNSDNLVEFQHTVYASGSPLQPVPGGLAGLRSTSSPPVGYTTSWSYRVSQKVSAYSSAGQRIFDVAFGSGPQTRTTTAVLYGSSTWWTANSAEPPATGSAAPGCVQGSGVHVELRPGPGNGWPAFIREQLACGAYSVTGRQQVNGVGAIQLSGSSGLITLWVNPKTYLPVRVFVRPPGQAAGQAQNQTSFQWLAPTLANLAELQLAVPAGFTQVQPPAVVVPAHGRG